MPSENESITPNESLSGGETEPNIDADDASLARSKEVSELEKEVPVESPLESSDGAIIAPQPTTPSAVSASKLDGLGWLIRVGVNSAAVLAVGALLLVLIGVAQRTDWITAGGFGGESGSRGGRRQQRRTPTLSSAP